MRAGLEAITRVFVDLGVDFADGDWRSAQYWRPALPVRLPIGQAYASPVKDRRLTPLAGTRDTAIAVMMCRS